MAIICPTCNGKGRVFPLVLNSDDSIYQCPSCHGNLIIGTGNLKASLSINVPNKFRAKYWEFRKVEALIIINLEQETYDFPKIKFELPEYIPMIMKAYFKVTKSLIKSCKKYPKLPKSLKLIPAMGRHHASWCKIEKK
jgi:hypothetical protein